MQTSPIYRAQEKLPKYTAWSATMRNRFPVDTTKIPGFKRWVSVNRFSPPEHDGFDLTAFETTEGHLTMGLPPGLEIFPLLDGIVLDIPHRGARNYFSEIWIGHSFSSECLLSAAYVHTNPRQGLKPGDLVRHDEPLGHLMLDTPAFFSYKYHLHLSLCVGLGGFDNQGLFCGQIRRNFIDPEQVLFPEERPPFARYVHPEISWSETAQAPVWPSEEETRARQG